MPQAAMEVRAFFKAKLQESAAADRMGALEPPAGQIAFLAKEPAAVAVAPVAETEVREVRVLYPALSAARAERADSPAVPREITPAQPEMRAPGEAAAALTASTGHF